LCLAWSQTIGLASPLPAYGKACHQFHAGVFDALSPQVRIRQHCFQCLSADAPEADQHVAWGLGWGLEPDAGSFFHWGDNGGFKAFVVGSRSDRSAVVVFTNGSNGLAIMPDVIHQLMPGDHPAFAWLGYDPRVAH
jgi:hypothetical protein